MEQNLNQKIVDWAVERQLTGHENAPKQMLKLAEEFGELAGAVARGDRELIEDSLGDMQVVLIILGEQLGLPADRALQSAYNVIKECTGRTVNGVFIKDGE